MKKLSQITFVALLSLYVGSTVAQPSLSVQKVPFKLSKNGAKNGALVFSEADQEEKVIYNVYEYSVQKKKKDPITPFYDVIGFDAANGKVLPTASYRQGEVDLMEKYNLKPLTSKEIAVIETLSAISNDPPNEVVEFSGIKLFAREGRLYKGSVGLMEYEETGSKQRLADSWENFLSPIAVHPIDDDFSAYFSNVSLNTGFFARNTFYALVSKGARAFVLGSVQGKLYAGVYNTGKMDYDVSGFPELTYSFNTMISYGVDPVDKQLTLKYTTSDTDPRVAEIVLDMTSGAILIEKLITPQLTGVSTKYAGLSPLTGDNFLEYEDHQYVALFTEDQSSGKLTGRFKLKSFDVYKLKKSNTIWSQKFSLEELVTNLATVPGEKKKAKFDTKGTLGYIDQITSIGEDLLITGHFTLGGASVSVAGKGVTSAGQGKTFIAQLSSATGEMKTFFQFDNVNLRGAEGSVMTPAISFQNDKEIVLTLRSIAKPAGVYSYTTESSTSITTTTYRLVNDYGWVKIHKVNLETAEISKGLKIMDEKAYVVVDEEPLRLKDGTILLDVQNKVVPGKKTKFTKYFVK